MKIDLDKYMEAPLGSPETRCFLAEVCATFRKYKVSFNNIDELLLLVKDATYADLCGYGNIFKDDEHNSQPEEPIKKSIFKLF